MSDPDGKSIAAADAVATSLEANRFLRSTLNSMIKAKHLEKEYESVNKALDEKSRIVEIRHANLEKIPEKAFNGNATQVDLDNLKPGAMNFIDASVYERLQNAEIATVVMPYYIDENSQLSRGYVIDGEVM